MITNSGTILLRYQRNRIQGKDTQMTHFMQHTAAFAARVSRLFTGVAIEALGTPSQEQRVERGLKRTNGLTGSSMRKSQKPSGYRAIPSLILGQNARNTTFSRPALDWCPSVRIPAVAGS